MEKEEIDITKIADKCQKLGSLFGLNIKNHNFQTFDLHYVHYVHVPLMFSFAGNICTADLKIMEIRTSITVKQT